MNKKQKKQLQSLGLYSKTLDSMQEGNTWVSVVLLSLACIMLGGFLFAILIFSGGTDAFMTDGHCNDMINNQTNQSFINGVYYGSQQMEAAIITQSIECNPIPFEYQNQTLNLILLECLNLNNNGGQK